jgi:probable F420-dependent oxidoreductase
VEQTAIMSSDPAVARGIARPWAADYLDLPNYANNWRRLGYEDELGHGGSDRLIDAAFACGDVSSIATRVREHLEAGADHVCVQVISGQDDDVCLPALRELADALL